MKNIELNDTNWFARYHKFIYGELPDNFCPFFWQLLAAILLFPLVIPSEIQNNYLTDGRSKRPLYAKIVISLLIYIGLILTAGFGGSIMEEIWSAEVIHGWNLGGWLILISLVCGILTIVGALVCIVLILGGYSYIHDELRERKFKKKFKNAQSIPQGPSQLRLMIDNIRSKYCTKIVWKTKTLESE